MAGVNDAGNHTEGGQSRQAAGEFIIWRSFFVLHEQRVIKDGQCGSLNVNVCVCVCVCVCV